ncbi:Disintegrin and metalloproteinase domain-containing protein 19 [Liparis tanakae]|uniref:Disintegrin and metalloproteinase domain-containing protein 19 n=1 Tax=Liparis tanakae TaxID=230148 RepID=A0A4Z2F5D1_9TELE|nr:Disintegrin and metalloproteinase domain-containing protein 19 [Liparis tanakae]
MAHEIGHNFGMSHDHDGCCVEASAEQGGCVMAAATGRCSKRDLDSYFQKGGGMCLFNMPDMKDLVGGKKCGNGFVEDGEECDCGEADLKQAGTLCRGPAGACDLPEYCTGASPYCPANVYLLDGSVCQYGVAYCYNGMCLTHQQQCLQLWGYDQWAGLRPQTSGQGYGKGRPVATHCVPLTSDQWATIDLQQSGSVCGVGFSVSSESADQQRKHGRFYRSTILVIVLDELLYRVVKMCDQKNGGDHGEALNSEDVDDLSASDESEPEELHRSAPFDPELDDDDDDDDDGEVVISAPAAGHRAQTPFSLRGGGSAFSNRSHSIFECLDSVARLASSSVTQDKVTDGVFARPLPPRSRRKMSQPVSSCPTPAKKRGIPDYVVHPERWTHYSLEDVEETSDKDNRKAAHSFLSSLQQRKGQQESPSDAASDSQQKVIFSRPSGTPKEPPADQLPVVPADELPVVPADQLPVVPADQLPVVRGKEKETRLCHLEDDVEDEEGREKETAGGGRTDRRKEKAEEKLKDEEKDRRGAVGPPEEKKRVQKVTHEEEEDEEEEMEKMGKMEKMEEANSAFTSFRKTKRMNYRKGSGREDN